ncbi:MAG: hypothetical protein HY329_03305 [Chloroflexi bacterium]|nr:hypothetical protein [Chloroflexota bacterium]
MADRLVLADCCEDWILEYGRFYRQGDHFHCPECRTEWEKTGRGELRRLGDGRRFVERARVADDATFAYLAADPGPEPLVERCCAKIILGKGPLMAEGPFWCPICRAEWQRGSGRAAGIRVATFARQNLPEPMVIQNGPIRSFLVPLSSWRPMAD